MEQDSLTGRQTFIENLAKKPTGQLDLFFTSAGYGAAFNRASTGYGRAKRIADVLRAAEAAGDLENLLANAARTFARKEDMRTTEPPAWFQTGAGTCFVIQPFDRGPYDNRYDDVYSVAIRAAGFEPYRVDRDPSASVPIEKIASEIRDAAVCFADISEDNPNVWFELGLAIASAKEVVLVCSSKRSGFPFDVQHRHVIRYETESRRNFDDLGQQITERLVAAGKIVQGRETIEDLSPVKATAGLSAHEQVLLVLVAQRMDTPQPWVGYYLVRQDMQAAGFNDIAFVLSARALAKRQFIAVGVQVNQNDEEYSVYSVTEPGFVWLEQNQEKISLRREGKPTAPAPITYEDTDIDDLPF